MEYIIRKTENGSTIELKGSNDQLILFSEICKSLDLNAKLEGKSLWVYDVQNPQELMTKLRERGSKLGIAFNEIVKMKMGEETSPAVPEETIKKEDEIWKDGTVLTRWNKVWIIKPGDDGKLQAYCHDLGVWRYCDTKRKTIGTISKEEKLLETKTESESKTESPFKSQFQQGKEIRKGIIWLNPGEVYDTNLECVFGYGEEKGEIFFGVKRPATKEELEIIDPSGKYIKDKKTPETSKPPEVVYVDEDVKKSVIRTGEQEYWIKDDESGVIISEKKSTLKECKEILLKEFAATIREKEKNNIPFMDNVSFKEGELITFDDKTWLTVKDSEGDLIAYCKTTNEYREVNNEYRTLGNIIPSNSTNQKNVDVKPVSNDEVKYKRGDIIRQGMICLNDHEALSLKTLKVHRFVAATGAIFAPQRDADENDKQVIPQETKSNNKTNINNMDQKNEIMETKTDPPQTTEKKGSIAKRGETYKVGGKKVPDSALAQQWANDDGVSTEILFCDMINDDRQLKAIVRSSKGNQYTDVCMIIDFATEAELTIMQKWKKELRCDEWQVFKNLHDENNPKYEINKAAFEAQVRYEILMKKQFASRTAVTKAARQGQLKLLNKEFRENEELNSENTEKQAVEGN